MLFFSKQYIRPVAAFVSVVKNNGGYKESIKYTSITVYLMMLKFFLAGNDVYYADYRDYRTSRSASTHSAILN